MRVSASGVAEPAADSAHRRRLLDGMARAVAARGYADVTIADIVREAAVSRRTFYEHFATKADCLVALYEAASHQALGVLRAAIDPARDWRAQAEQAMTAYLAALARSPALLRTLFIEILALGPVGLAARRRVNDALAGFVLQVVNGHAGPRNGPAAELAPQTAVAIVGAINELVLQAIEQDRIDALERLAAPAVELLQALAQPRR